MTTMFIRSSKVAVAVNVPQVYLVAEFENKNFKFRTNEHRRTKLE